MSKDVVLVTGGAGFIGSHLIERLLGDGNEVHVLDHIPIDQASNLRSVRDHPNLKYTTADLRDAAAVSAWYRKDAVCLYHLGSVVGVRYYLEDPLALIDVVVSGTRTLLENARNHGTRVLFASTSEIYGKNSQTPWAEDGDRVLGPTSVDRWSYSSSKAVCEHMLYGLYRQSNLPFSIVRFFNVYGPRQRPIYVVSQSIYRALRGEPALVYDDGRQTRCFTYVDDVIDGIVNASQSPQAIGEAFNLGNPVEVTIRQVVDMVLEAVGGKAGQVAFDTTREYGAAYEDIPRRVPDVSKASAKLDWHASVRVEDGIRRTVDWARKNPSWLADLD